MASAVLVSVQEYLSNVYEPDCDFVDGHLEERNLGEPGHSALQAILSALINSRRKEWNVLAYTELRLQVAADRYRVPDITVLRRSDPKDSIVRHPPLVCIEVLSPEDRIQRMRERFADYFRMGVANVWLIDPTTRDAWVALPDGSLQHTSTEFTVPGTGIGIVLADVFAELDEMQRQA